MSETREVITPDGNLKAEAAPKSEGDPDTLTARESLVIYLLLKIASLLAPRSWRYDIDKIDAQIRFGSHNR